MLDQNLRMGISSAVLCWKQSYQRLAMRINIRTVEGVAADDVDIFGEMLLEGSNLRSFARSLATDDGTLFRCFNGSVTQHHRRVSQAIVQGPYPATTLSIDAASTL